MRGIDRLQLLHDDGQFPEAALTDYDLQICCKKDQAHDAAVMASTALSLLGSVLPGSRKLIGSCAHALNLLVERRLGTRAADRPAWANFDSSAASTKYSSLRNFSAGDGISKASS